MAKAIYLRKTPIVLEKAAAIERLNATLELFYKEVHDIPSDFRDESLYELGAYLETVMQLLQTSAAEKFRFHYLGDSRKGICFIPHIYLPVISQVNVWAIFVNIK